MKFVAYCIVLLSLVTALVLEVALPVSLLLFENIDVPVAILTMVFSNGTILGWISDCSDHFENLSARQQALLACLYTIIVFNILLICI